MSNPSGKLVECGLSCRKKAVLSTYGLGLSRLAHGPVTSPNCQGTWEELYPSMSLVRGLPTLVQTADPELTLWFSSSSSLPWSRVNPDCPGTWWCQSLPLVTGLLLTFLTVDPDAALGLATGLLYYSLTASLPAQRPIQGPGWSYTHLHPWEQASCLWIQKWLWNLAPSVYDWGPEGNSFHLGTQQEPHSSTPPVTGLLAMYPPTDPVAATWPLSSPTQLWPQRQFQHKVFTCQNQYIKKSSLLQMNRHQCRLHGLWKY